VPGAKGDQCLGDAIGVGLVVDDEGDRRGHGGGGTQSPIFTRAPAREKSGASVRCPAAVGCVTRRLDAVPAWRWKSSRVIAADADAERSMRA
jgi:hypothetical protein